MEFQNTFGSYTLPSASTPESIWAYIWNQRTTGSLNKLDPGTAHAEHLNEKRENILRVGFRLPRGTATKHVIRSGKGKNSNKEKSTGQHSKLRTKKRTGVCKNGNKQLQRKLRTENTHWTFARIRQCRGNKLKTHTGHLQEYGNANLEERKHVLDICKNTAMQQCTGNMQPNRTKHE